MAIIIRGGPLKSYDSISLLFKNKCFVVYFFIFFYPELLKFLAMNWNALINFPNFARSFLANLFQVLVEHRCKLRGNESNHEMKLKETHKEKAWEVSESFLTWISELLCSGKQNCIYETEVLSTLSRLCVDFQTRPLLEETKPTFSVTFATAALINNSF